MTSIAANTWIWVSPLSDDALAELAPRIRGWGFDAIELPIEQPDDWDPDRASDLLTELGLGATTCAVMPETRDLVSADRAVVASTQAYLRQCIEIAATVGAEIVAGPIYAPVGRTWLLDDSARAATIAQLVEALRPLADAAGERGVRLGIEPLNRYETSLINTVDQALEVAEAVDSPALGISLDSFHMNIEERDPAGAIRRAGRWLVHFQACANDRGAPGADHIDWSSIAAALREVDYRGIVAIESFTAHNATIARAAAIWRPLAPSQDRLATGGLAFLRELFAGEGGDAANRRVPAAAEMEAR